MLKTLGIVQVRCEAGKLDPKISRKLGGSSLLELVVRRVTDCQRLDGVVVVVTGNPKSEQVRHLVPPDVSVFAPASGDPLATFVAALDRYDARAMVRVCAHNPFVDPVLVDRLVSTADAQRDCDYVTYRKADGRPAVMTQLGVFAEWCSASALRRAVREARTPADRDQVTSYVYSNPDRFGVNLLPLPAELDREDLRLRIDVEEDWDHAQVIYEALGSDEWDWQRIADLLHSQPALRSRMAHLNRAPARV